MTNTNVFWGIFLDILKNKTKFVVGLQIVVSCILCDLIILEMILDFEEHWSPPVGNGVDWT